ncbi:hypothetical protein HMPREF1989_00937 [Porphyromonas gingivalis F0566]|nr:hypothetical protein HMPREF1989_00937 [Porphyromonas gingivalis F0566]
MQQSRMNEYMFALTTRTVYGVVVFAVMRRKDSGRSVFRKDNHRTEKTGKRLSRPGRPDI